ncbi:MAG: response regulator transcription factor [Bacteroidales bacterium]
MTKKIRIILADDHRIFRDGMKALLNENTEIQIIGEGSDGNELMELLKSNQPDVLILDISMPGLSGIELTKLIHNLYPEIRIMILSMHTNEEFVLNAIHAGAKAYLPKDTSKAELFEAIQSLMAGGEYYSKSVSENFMKSFIKKTRTDQNLLVNEELTLREIEILKLVATGISHKEVAEMLFISPKTVDAHKNHIMQKLKLKNTAELVLYAVTHKIIEV